LDVFGCNANEEQSENADCRQFWSIEARALHLPSHELRQGPEKKASRAAGTISQELVGRWLDLPADGISAPAMTRAALCLKDTIGIALAAVALDIGTAGTRLAQAGVGSASMWGSGRQSTVTDAAFANGMLAHAMDYDDLHPAGIMHSSAIVVPTAVALAEQHDLSGTEMLAAVVLGHEVAARLGRLAPGDFQKNGFQSTAVLGVFASAFSAARLLKLTEGQAVHALGIAGSMASGLMEFLADGSETKQMHAGWAAQNGIRAAQLAALGFTGPASVFEGRFGVYRSFIGKDVDASEWEGNDPDIWAVEEVCPKPYPACLCLHPVVQGVLEIRSRFAATDLDPAGICSIRCEIPSFYAGLVFDPPERKMAPQTSYEARFSAPYCMAAAWIDGVLDVESFAGRRLADPRILALASKVSYAIKELPEFPETFPARVTIERTGGETFGSYVAANLGSRKNPMSDTQLQEKFMRCAQVGMTAETAGELAGSIDKLTAPDGNHRFFCAVKSARADRQVAGQRPVETATVRARQAAIGRQAHG
jgi:2-methylcitrate dehydratase PrpD